MDAQGKPIKCAAALPREIADDGALGAQQDQVDGNGSEQPQCDAAAAAGSERRQQRGAAAAANASNEALRAKERQDAKDFAEARARGES